MSEEREWNAEVIAEFRANKGEVKAPYDDPPPMLLLHTIGAKSHNFALQAARFPVLRSTSDGLPGRYR